MLDKFKKLLGTKEGQEQLEQNTQQTVDADQYEHVLADLKETKFAFDKFKEEAETLLTQATAEIEELKTKLEAANAAIASAEEFKAKAEADAKAMKLAARKEKIEAAIGTEKADGLMLATEALDDTAFNAVLSALVGSVEAEAKTDAFKEVGVDAKAKASVQDPVERLKQRLAEENNPQ